MLRFLRIVHPRNTKLSFPRLQSTLRVFTGCNIRPSRFITNPIRRSASLIGVETPVPRGAIEDYRRLKGKMALPLASMSTA
jgi:hypothetical protein